MGLRWGFIGCGTLGQALIIGAIQKKILKAPDVYVTDTNPSKLKSFSRKNKINVCASNAMLAEKCDIIFLVTKPQDILGPLTEIAPRLNETKAVVSLAAGVNSKLLRGHLKAAGVLVRVMGNTPALIQRGFFGVYIFRGAAGKERTTIQKKILEFFGALGEITLVKSDQQIDAITAASASGVGFVFMFMEQFGAWLEQRGFTAADARRAVVETFLGAAALAKHRPEVPLARLRDQVTSKKGTTLAGLEAMKKLKVAPGLKSGLAAALKRSSTIAKNLLKGAK